MNKHILAILKTLISKSGVIAVNFFIVVLSTNLWGSEGRGMISILMANVAIIAIFNNIFAGANVSFFLSRLGLANLILPALIWIPLSSVLLTFVFSCFQKNTDILSLVLLAITNSIVNLVLMIFIGYQNLKLYNLFNFLSPFVLLILILAIEYGLGMHSWKAYVYGNMVAQAVVAIWGFLRIRKDLSFKKLKFSWEVVKSLSKYGYKNELSSLLQFLNYRLSYFFILYYQGVRNVGLFSVGVAISESVWVISRSISTVQYAQIVNMDKDARSVSLTNRSAVISLIASSVLLVLALIIPQSVYSLVFGKDFSSVKEVLLLLSPGILAIAVSNIWGHYFSATNRLEILILKSVLGLVTTVGLSVWFIPIWGLTGACWVCSISYIVSSGCLAYKYFWSSYR